MGDRERGGGSFDGAGPLLSSIREQNIVCNEKKTDNLYAMEHVTVKVCHRKSSHFFFVYYLRKREVMSIFLAKPIEVEAVYFDGNNFAEVQKMCGMHMSLGKDYFLDTFAPLGNYFMSENPSHVAELWVQNARSWVGVPAQVWIIKDQDDSIWMTAEDFRNHYTMKTYV